MKNGVFHGRGCVMIIPKDVELGDDVMDDFCFVVFSEQESF